jgi:outer membrane protein assembly factor BamE (lipoprotein component of BamABCDE complex)
MKKLHRIAMKRTAASLAAVVVLAAASAAGAESFRLENGQLLEEGMTKAEVLDAAGKPAMKDSQGRLRGHAYKREVWTFYANNTFGTPHIVTVTFEGGTVTHIASRPRTRR